MKSILQNVKKRVGGSSGSNSNNMSGSPEAGHSPPSSFSSAASSRLDGGGHITGDYISPAATAAAHHGMTAAAAAGGGGGGGLDGEGHAACLPHSSLLSLSPTSGAAQLAAQAIAEGTPRADPTLPRHTPQRRRSSLIRNQQRMAALKDLPMLRDTSAARREALFQQKLQLCAVVFNFDDPQV
ncbi:hypothetical protein VYU27_009363 [Nannochloropsis oceanica]